MTLQVTCLLYHKLYLKLFIFHMCYNAHMKRQKPLILLTLLLLLSSCAKATDQRFSKIALDTGFKDITVTLIAYTDKQESFDSYFNQMSSDFKSLGQLYDKYTNVDGLINLKTINDTAGLGPQTVDQALIDLFVTAKQWTTDTKNTFNPSIGALLNIWHAYREEGKLLNQENPIDYGKVPNLTELEAANVYSGWDNIIIDDANNTIEITNPYTQVDVGGIGKGFAADIVVANLKASGLTTAIINIGDSSILTIGSKPDGSEWGIGISQPTRPALIGANTVDTLYFPADISVSTSGDNQNYYIAEDGNTYHHIIDPSTLFPVVTDLHAVTVVTDLKAGDAEALSKAFFIMPYDEAMTYYADIQAKYPNNFIGVLWVYELDKAPANASNIINSEGFTLVHTDNLIEHSRLYR